jgi:hypothetical protein
MPHVQQRGMIMPGQGPVHRVGSKTESGGASPARKQYAVFGASVGTDPASGKPRPIYCIKTGVGRFRD